MTDAGGGTAGARGPYANGRATRHHVLDAAMALFGEVGYRSASLREVAARAGISHPGLMHHFGSKAALLAAVLERRDELDEAAMAADVAAGDDVLTALVRVVERNVERPRIVQLFVTLSAEATAPDHPAHAFFAQRYARHVRRTADDLRRLADDGRLRPGVDPVVAARLVLATMDGLQVQWLLAGPTTGAVDMPAEFRALLATLVAPD
ncbi:TetR/AcrR family transcriptional regulator [Cellulomonas phragmiteti]|uniref:TetR family transcriptional regulator n=1 Tax=Cellulomonas phragmiteti TaxID=478780 RepID=A0ABQ4DN93_9CELL|nr:TetR/AcrR family transcriptional regulator [Cellulomonas phragmiteti]GIG40824.1 TetR family transcriptional regulator [Cellulomonas phragmiteti]